MSKKVYCMLCHKEMPYEANNCSNCGCSLSVAKQDADLLESLGQPFKKKNNLWAILGFIFAIVAIPFKILFLDMKRK